MKSYIRKQLIIVTLACSCLPGFAQRDIPKDDKTYTMEINAKDFIEKITVARNNPAKAKVCKHLWYYWYLNNAVHFTEGGYSGKLLNGQYTSYYKSMNLRSSGTFKYGLMNNEWKMWYENGAMKSIERWKKGIKQGSCVYFSEDGIHRTIENYRRGILNGKQKVFCSDSLIAIRKFKNGKEIIRKIKNKTVSPSDSQKERKVVKPDPMRDSKIQAEGKNRERKAGEQKNKVEKPANSGRNTEKTGIRVWPFRSKNKAE